MSGNGGELGSHLCGGPIDPNCDLERELLLSRTRSQELAEVVIADCDGELCFSAELHLPGIEPDGISAVFCLRAIATGDGEEPCRKFDFGGKAVCSAASGCIVAELTLCPDVLLHSAASGLVEVSGFLRLTFGGCELELPLVLSSAFGKEAPFIFRIDSSCFIARANDSGSDVLLELGTTDAWFQIEAKNTIERFKWTDGAACFWGRLEHPIAGAPGLALGLTEKGALDSNILVNASIES